MSVEATSGAPIMPLRQLVDRYLALAGSFGTPVALAAFELTEPETENLFSSYNEDYHISRFFHFSNSAGHFLQYRERSRHAHCDRCRN